MKILHIDSSILGGASASRTLTAAVVDALVAEHPAAEVVRRDLAADPLPHFSDPTRPAEAPLEEFLAADVVVIGAPFYNFTIPSQLKAWIDRLAVPGRTFRYTEKGPVGLAGGKRIIVAHSRGGIYSEGPAAGMDFAEPYLRGIFRFFGIDEIEILRAEGLNLSPESKAAAMAAALEEAPRLVARVTEEFRAAA